MSRQKEVRDLIYLKTYPSIMMNIFKSGKTFGSKISKETGLVKSSVYHSLKKLEKYGLIRKKEGKKKKTITLTQDGMDLSENIMESLRCIK